MSQIRWYVLVVLSLVLTSFPIEQAEAQGLPVGYPNPLVANGDTVELWGRVYTFTKNCGPIPKMRTAVEVEPGQVVTDCTWTLNNERLNWTVKRAQSISPEEVRVTARANHRAGKERFRVTATSTVDVSGVVKIDYQIENVGRSSAQVNLAYQIDLSEEAGGWMSKHLLYDPATFTVTKGDILTDMGAFQSGSHEFIAALHVGSRERGFEIVWRGDAAWLPVDKTGNDPNCPGPRPTPIQTGLAGSTGSDPFIRVEPLPVGCERTLISGETWSDQLMVVGTPLRPSVPDALSFVSAPVGQANNWWRPVSETGRKGYHVHFGGGNPTLVLPWDGLPVPVSTSDLGFTDYMNLGNSRDWKTILYGSGVRSVYLHPDWYQYYDKWKASDKNPNIFVGQGGTKPDSVIWAEAEENNVLNFYGEPWEKPWVDPWDGGTTKIRLECTAPGQPWGCCTGAGQDNDGQCVRQRMFYGYVGGCDNGQAGPSFFDARREAYIAALSDPAMQNDGFYDDFGNIGRACSLEPGMTPDSEQQIYRYRELLFDYYKQLYVERYNLDADSLHVIHTTASPKILSAYVDIELWGETLNVPFGGVSSGAGHSGCADGQCDTGSEAASCQPFDGICTAGPGCGYCPDYMGLGEDFYTAIEYPRGGAVRSLLPEVKHALDAEECMWQRNFFGAVRVLGISYWLGNLGNLDCMRAHHKVLDNFGSLADADLLVTRNPETEGLISATNGAKLGVFAHPDTQGCTYLCDKEGIVFVANWSASDLTTTVTFADYAGLGLTDGGVAVSEYRVWDPVAQPSGDPDPNWPSSWSAISQDQIGGLAIPARSYLAVEVR